MADPENLSSARLLVRSDLSAVRMDAVLGLSARPAGARRARTGPEPEVPANGALEAGKLYPDHASPGTSTWIQRWQLGEGEKLHVVVRYWGPGVGPPEGGAGGGKVGDITVRLVNPPAPESAGSATPVQVAPGEVTASLRYHLRQPGVEGSVVRRIDLGPLGGTVAGSGIIDGMRPNDAAARFSAPLRTTEDAQTLVSALQQPDTTLVLRTHVTAWMRSWNQTVVGSKGALRGNVKIAEAVATKEFTALKADPRVVAAVSKELSVTMVKAAIPRPTIETRIQPELHAIPRVQPEPVESPVLTTRLNPLVANLRLTPTRFTVATPTTPTAPATPEAPAPAPVEETPAEAPLALKHRISLDVLAATKVLKVAQATGEASAPAAVIDATAVANVARLKLDGRLLAPARAVVEEDGEPAWVQSRVPVEWEIPFCFPYTDANKRHYEVGTNSLVGAPTLLRPLVVHDSAGRQLFGVYQESILDNRIHLVPQVYRLARAPDPPCLPQLRIVASEFVTAAEDGVEPVYRVGITYALEPWIPPDVRLAVAQTLNRQPHELHFLVSPPLSASMRLTLPDGPSERTAATVDANGHITDVLELTHESFSRLVRTLRDDPSSGITGTVSARLLDGQQTAESAVRLALGFEAEHLLDTVVVGVDAGKTRWTVQLRNRVESPVRIEECRALRLEGGSAAPVAETVPTGRVLQPGEQVTVDYLVEPPGTPFVVETVPVRATPVPDVENLLRLLVLSVGGTPGVVELEVAGHFPPPGDPAFVADPLLALRVEFDDESVVLLTPEAPTKRVTLAGRLLDVALGRPVQRYFFRVQNMNTSGPGAASGWLARDVGARLDVPWVVATLPDAF